MKYFFLLLICFQISSEVKVDSEILSGIGLVDYNDKIRSIENNFNKLIYIEIKKQTDSNQIDEFVAEKTKYSNGIYIYISLKEKRIFVLDKSKENPLKDSDLYLLKTNLIKYFKDKKYEEGIFNLISEVEISLNKNQLESIEKKKLEKSILLENLPTIGILFFSILGIFILVKLIIKVFLSKKDLNFPEISEPDSEIANQSPFQKKENDNFDFLNSSQIKEKEFDSENDNEFKKREQNET